MTSSLRLLWVWWDNCVAACSRCRRQPKEQAGLECVSRHERLTPELQDVLFNTSVGDAIKAYKAFVEGGCESLVAMYPSVAPITAKYKISTIPNALTASSTTPKGSWSFHIWKFYTNFCCLGPTIPRKGSINNAIHKSYFEPKNVSPLFSWSFHLVSLNANVAVSAIPCEFKATPTDTEKDFLVYMCEVGHTLRPLTLI